ncbi:MAG: hypothetical protein R3Y68_00180 [Rikenellaceae bacterium]
MKKKFYSTRFMQGAFALLAASLVAGCNVDDSYDLSTIDTDNIGLGSDTSVLDIPLATIKLSLSSITDDGAAGVASRSTGYDTSSLSATEMLELMETIDAFLPSDLSGTEYKNGIDITKLNNDDSYTQGLVDMLVAEVTVDEEKRADLCEILVDNYNDESNSDYDDVITSLEEDLEIVIDDNTTADDLTVSLGVALNDPDKTGAVASLSTTMTSVVKTQAADITTDYTVTEDLGDSVSLGDDVLDILKGNLDSETNYLYLVSSISHNIPMTVTITPSIILTDTESGETEEIEIKDVAMIDDASAHTKLSDKQIDMLVNGLSIEAAIHINYYDPSAGTLSIDDKEVKVTLVARKGGSISL